MQIHDLNDFNGSLGAGSFVVVDDGVDTGKVSISQLFAKTDGEINELDIDLNARIDNIIAGGDAPSEAEIIDARIGVDNTVYPSLGDAIRGQISIVESDFETSVNRAYKSESGLAMIPAVFVNGTWAGGSFSTAALYNYRVGMPHYIELDRDIVLTAETGYTMRVYDFNPDGTFRSELADSVQTYTMPANTKFAITVKNTVNETIKAKADVPTYAAAVTFKNYAEYRLEDEIASVNGYYSPMVNAIKRKMELKESPNLYNGSEYIAGFIQKSGSYASSDSYTVSPFIEVSEGDSFSFWGGDAVIEAKNCRFLCAYDSNKLPVSSAGSDANITTYTVPAGISFVRWSFANSITSLGTFQILKGTIAPVRYQPYFDPYYVATDAFIQEITPLVQQVNKGYYRGALASMSDGDSISIPKMNIAKNLKYAFSCKVNSFSSVEIGQGISSDAYDSFVKVNSSQVVININGADYAADHGLTIADYLNITITVNDNTKATILVESNGGSYSRTLGWYGFINSNYYVKCVSSSLSDCVFTLSLQDINANTYVFGDSYVAIVESTSKWSHWLVADNYGDNILLNGFPGEGSGPALSALENLIEIGKPKHILWALGMNDGSDVGGNPNSTWMSSIFDFLDLCDENGIVPILATIPTVPAVNNEAKNTWIRTSGYRYVDFAKAVGANSSGVWYSGMLSGDNIHPSELGAKALYHRVLCDAPEVTMK